VGRTAQSFVTGIIIIAILFVLVRPGSQGPGLVSGVSSGLAGLVNSATGGGGWGAGAPAKKA
jgi:hypothetical protein